MAAVETSITPDLYAKLKDCEAVAVRHYERPDGSRFCKVFAAGSNDEMKELTETPGLLLSFPGAEYLGDTVVPVSELVPPAASDDDEVTL
jgi:hypothetical protein